MPLTRRILLSGTTSMLATAAGAQPSAVQIYAAMTFRPVLEQILAAYRKTGGNAVAVYAPTPTLVRQLAAGAQADILLTADPMWMDEAAKQDLIQPDTRANLIANDLVLAAPTGTAHIGTLTSQFPLASMLGDGHLAMCYPDHDPAGRYGKQALQSLDLWPQAQSHIAIAESAPAAVVLLDRGEARAVIAFRTDLHNDPHATIAGIFPPDSHAPIIYPIALTKSPPSPQAPAALGFLKSPDAMQIFDTFGYRRAS